ncbi:cobalamin B12-binding domain-containing protein [Kitasatospora sp. NBC_01287]|uniref:cobalamin B12-binding domain-containing protein n=1 Tax=Kitasatospora sp. NBC_01287 TaxID=2903573 RepID=UPI002258BA06|nr:cobalamin B12-binding domain-containing protein [Kitasatospora sp. NBC_01287]MCX4744347.1 cobalamin B12-binding domain-containing protein [Kitasatospora sp. NBC_01287]
MVLRQQPQSNAPTPGAGTHSAGKRKVVLSTIPSDSHTWNLLFLQLLLEEHGCAVTNLGACVPVATLVGESAQSRPDLIVISTVNGHGLHEGQDLARAVRASAELRQVPLVIGGKIDTAGSGADTDFLPLFEAGFDAVLVGETAVPELLALLDRLPAAAALAPSAAALARKAYAHATR